MYLSSLSRQQMISHEIYFFMYMINKRGSKIAPCGKPVVTNIIDALLNLISKPTFRPC